MKNQLQNFHEEGGSLLSKLVELPRVGKSCNHAGQITNKNEKACNSSDLLSLYKVFVLPDCLEPTLQTLQDGLVANESKTHLVFHAVYIYIYIYIFFLFLFQLFKGQLKNNNHSIDHHITKHRSTTKRPRECPSISYSHWRRN